MPNTYARVSDDIVTEIISLPDGISVESAYHPSIAATLVKCDPNVSLGWVLFNGSFSAPTAVAPSKDDLISYANQKQWSLAIGGYSAMINSEVVKFATDPLSQSLIIGKALRLSQPEPPVLVNWQSGASFAEIATSDFLNVATLIADFIQATFDALNNVLSAIEGGTIADFESIDAALWPLNHDNTAV
ncbi:DUF4376 domain-containing protein [Rhizobium rhizogenes]|uniref:DUF4376 domain-containing protein n=1 Tax=Rhizobium rhizogenes TaxID=359 RepID=UPI0004D8CFE0|nr:hypothetical protein [Rhizobium rhizogenes]KEA07110.1 hypothetical protein CN09_09105 [Rhizobium rhizogenes]NTI80469.1 hypothetical protein [Rhizobium rhizogenes]NTJ22655.1 hypothetical protein [Rhizobium rhizogenes]QUE81359.1 hypothetical protein EML492_06005 [Rhizobium rhizogenes]TQO80546.1 hypothetical protein FFE80_05435 [Rhizobium rhizogenes]